MHRAWTAVIGGPRPPAVCIGGSTAAAAEREEFERVWQCASPGVQALAELVAEAVSQL